MPKTRPDLDKSNSYFLANRLPVQHLVILDCEKNITGHIFEFNDNCKVWNY